MGGKGGKGQGGVGSKGGKGGKGGTGGKGGSGGTGGGGNSNNATPPLAVQLGDTRPPPFFAGTFQAAAEANPHGRHGGGGGGSGGSGGGGGLSERDVLYKRLLEARAQHKQAASSLKGRKRDAVDLRERVRRIAGSRKLAIETRVNESKWLVPIEKFMEEEGDGGYDDDGGRRVSVTRADQVAACRDPKLAAAMDAMKEVGDELKRAAVHKGRYYDSAVVHGGGVVQRFKTEELVRQLQGRREVLEKEIAESSAGIEDDEEQSEVHGTAVEEALSERAAELEVSLKHAQMSSSALEDQMQRAKRQLMDFDTKQHTPVPFPEVSS